MKGFSIIICCYNSACILPETLLYLSRLVKPKDWAIEVILVDNCCSDDTVKVARKVWKEYNSPWDFHVVEEKTPGLSAARIKGIETASYNYLLFCDDDNFLEKNYLVAASAILEEMPQIGALGGYAIAMHEERPAYWPLDFYVYGSGPQADRNGETRTLHGAGIIVNKEAYKKLKQAEFSFILSDRNGTTLTSGGDYELCYAISLAGYEIWYDDSLRFSHFIKANRVSKEYCRRFIHESAPALDVLEVYEYLIYGEKKTIWIFYLNRIKTILYHLKKFFISCRNKWRYRHDEQIRFLESFHIAFHLFRVKLICKNIVRYPKIIGKVRLLKQQLLQSESKEIEMTHVKS